MATAVIFVNWTLEMYGSTLAVRSKRVTAVVGPWARWWDWRTLAKTRGYGALVRRGGREGT